MNLLCQLGSIESLPAPPDWVTPKNSLLLQGDHDLSLAHYVAKHFMCHPASSDRNGKETNLLILHIIIHGKRVASGESGILSFFLSFRKGFIAEGS